MMTGVDPSFSSPAGETHIDRRSVLLSGAAVSFAAASDIGGSAMAATAKISDIVLMNGAELSAAIKAKRVSCAEVMSAYLDHIATVNPKVNAIVSLRDRDACMKDARDKDVELARGNYQGWMHGFPHAVKDLAA